MSECKRYVPVLRFKKAEKDALAALFQCNIDLSGLTPLLELVPNPFIKASQSVNLSLSDILGDIADSVLMHWGYDRPFFLDLWHLPWDLQKEDEIHPFVTFNSCALARGLHFIPVTGLDVTRTPAYQSAISDLVKLNGRGVCFRLLSKDLQAANLFDDLDILLQNLNIGPNDVDLIVDQQYFDGSHSKYISLSEISERIPFLQSWRTFTVICGTFPVNLSDQFKKNTMPLVTRMEWKLWLNQIEPGSKLLRIPDYGDYTIQHPIYEYIDELHTPSANIRYTSSVQWIIMRGASLGSDQGYEQYPALAQILCEEKDFCGPDYSVGDKYIYDKSLLMDNPNQGVGTGNPTTWLQAGINHHIVFVLRQLANLSLT